MTRFAALLIVIAALYAPLIERFGSLFQYFQSTLAYLVPPIVAVYLGGLFSARVTAAGAFWGIVGGLALGLALFLLQEVTGIWGAMALPTVHFTYMALPTVHFTYMALIIFGLTLALMALVSLAGPVPTERPAACFHWPDLKPESAAGGRGLSRDYRLQAAALGLLMLAFIAAFW